MAIPRRVAFLGLGIMGSRMAANLTRAGFELAVWNRTSERAQELAEAHGARVAASPAEAAVGADACVTMVVDGPQVEKILLGEDGAAESLPEARWPSTCRPSGLQPRASWRARWASVASTFSTRRSRARSRRPRTAR